MSRRIFRTKALKRFNENLNSVVLPRYATTPWRLVLWFLAGLLLGLTVLLWWIQIPIYVSGPAVVIDAPDHYSGNGEAVLAAFLPPSAVAEVQPKEMALVNLPALAASESDILLTRPVVMVEKVVTPPARVRARYNLDASLGLLVEGPTVVVLLKLDELGEQLIGSIGEVQVQVDTRRGITLVPGIGRLFKDTHQEIMPSPKNRRGRA